MTIHTRRLPADIPIYRNSEGPIVAGGESRFGSRGTHQTGTTIKSYTDDTGIVSVTINTNPGLVARFLWWYDKQFPEGFSPLVMGSSVSPLQVRAAEAPA